MLGFKHIKITGKNLWMIRIGLTILALFATFKLNKYLFVNPFFTDDNAFRFCLGYKTLEKNLYDICFCGGVSVDIGRIYFFSIGLWQLLFKIFKQVQAHVIYNLAHVLWLVITPFSCLILTGSIGLKKNEEILYYDFLFIFSLVSNVILIYSGSLHWAVDIFLICILATCFLKLEKKSSLFNVIISSVLCGLAIIINPLSIIPFFSFYIAILLINKKIPFRLISVICGGILLNLPLIVMSIKVFMENAACSTKDTYISGINLIFLRVLKLNFLSEGNCFLWGLYPVISAILILGLYILFKPRKWGSDKYYIFSTAILSGYIIFSYFFGGKIFINQNPLRMIFLIYPLILVPVVKTAVCIISSRIVIIVRFLLYILCLFGFIARIILFGPIIPENLPEDFLKLNQWINQKTNNSARILVEEASHQFSKSGNLIHPLYNSHILPMFAVKTDRQYIGGAVPWLRQCKWAYLWFMDGHFINQPINSFLLKEIKKYFQNYNIKWVICWTSESIDYFNKYPEYFKFEKDFGIFKVFSVTDNYSFIKNSEGSIEILPEYMRIKLDNKKDEIILKFHYHDKLYAQPELKIEKYETEDPAGFILIKDPPEDFNIYWNRK